MIRIKESELILNPDGSVYHLNLKPEDISDTLLFVGDQDRVEKITKHFDTIEFSTQKREFKTQTGTYKGKRISVISTGIGPDNIDIVLNELDALINIDFKTRTIKEKLNSLNIIRIGTSGSLQSDIPVDSFLIGTHGLDLNGMLHFYKLKDICNHEIEIGNNVTIGGNTVIYDTDFHSLDASARNNKLEDKKNAKWGKVTLKNNVFIGAHTTILKGVTINENSIIGACSVIAKDIPANEIWAGNPAKFIKSIE